MLFIATGFLFFVSSLAHTSSVFMRVWPSALFVLGLLFLFLVLNTKATKFNFFLAVFLTLAGIFFTLVENEIIPYTIKEWWPAFLIFVAIAVFALSFFKYKKIIARFAIPATMLLILGLVFLFFSFHFASISFRKFFILSFPFLLIGSGIFMIASFVIQKKNASATKVIEQGSNA